MHNKKWQVTLGWILTVAVLLACGLFSTSEPTPTATLVLPTPTQTQAPTPIPGIDAPIVLAEQDMKLLILGMDLEAGEQSGYLNLILRYAPPFDLPDAQWIARNSELTCGATSYQPRSMGLYVGDAGKLEHFRLIFDVPENINFTECALRLPGTIE
ncbi:MAG: hypothetical protein Q8L87_16930, partial [Anaerolineales bacterium]|nr:hypothetical protein [Anaerolineales bacterium]